MIKMKIRCRWSRLGALCLLIPVVFLLFGSAVFYDNVQAAKGIRLNKSRVTLLVGQSTNLAVKGTKKSVNWSSSNKAAVVVSKKGKVTAKGRGSAVIAAKTAGQVCKCKVLVKGYTFRSEQLLQEHYEKHGKEMGYENAAAYVAGANKVISSPDALFKLEAEDGDGVYFLEATGEIVFLSTDRYIRTYFISDINYFNRQ